MEAPNFAASAPARMVHWTACRTCGEKSVATLRDLLYGQLHQWVMQKVALRQFDYHDKVCVRCEANDVSRSANPVQITQQTTCSGFSERQQHRPHPYARSPSQQEPPKQTSTKFSCSECYKEYDTITETTHYQRHLHKKCSLCHLYTPCYGILLNHWANSVCGTRLNFPQFECFCCKQSFTRIQDLNIHQKETACPNCRGIFKCPPSLQAHSLQCHQAPPPTLFKCHHCPQVFSSHQDLSCHAVNSACSTCSMQFNCFGQMLQHKRSLASCQHCGTELHTEHEKTLHCELNQCTDCNLQFPCETQLKRHQCRPVQLEQLTLVSKCSHCFTQEDPVVHLWDRNCACGQKFLCNTLLKVHHKAGACRASQSVQEPIILPIHELAQCPKCSIVFIGQRGLNLHSGIADCRKSKAPRADCQYCGLSFANKVGKDKHAMLEHCPYCQDYCGCQEAVKKHFIECPKLVPPPEAMVRSPEEEAEEEKMAQLLLKDESAPVQEENSVEEEVPAPVLKEEQSELTVSEILMKAVHGGNVEGQSAEDEDFSYCLGSLVKTEIKAEPLVHADEDSDIEIVQEIFSSVYVKAESDSFE